MALKIDIYAPGGTVTFTEGIGNVDRIKVVYDAKVIVRAIIYYLDTSFDTFNQVPCKLYSVTAPPPVAVGDAYQGGIVAYLLAPGDTGYDAAVQHGLIAAATDMNPNRYWHRTASDLINVNGTAIGTGLANTIAIIAAYGAENNAAKLCADLVLNGYSDWFLPAKDEFQKLADNKNLIGGFSNTTYWCSTEFNVYGGWLYKFFDGQFAGSNKFNVLNFRAIRTF